MSIQIGVDYYPEQWPDRMDRGLLSGFVAIVV